MPNNRRFQFRARRSNPAPSVFPKLAAALLVAALLGVLAQVVTSSGVETDGTAAAPLRVGDTGPGGGVIFYAADAPFLCGTTLAATCRYLEVAPADLPESSVWCSDSSVRLGSTATMLGAGMQNTVTADKACTSGAVRAAADYTNNELVDWFLPSRDELNELCKYARTQVTGDASTLCHSTGVLRQDFSSDVYWSSSEIHPSLARNHDFGDGKRYFNFKNLRHRVRPIRAF